MLLAEERDGKLVLEAATAVRVRDLPKERIRQWITDDDTEMDAFKKSGKRPKD